MRTIPIPALALCLLTPLSALAQTDLGPDQGRWVTTSPLFWFWVVAIAIAIAAFVWSNIAFSRRGGPPSRPRIS